MPEKKQDPGSVTDERADQDREPADPILDVLAARHSLPDKKPLDNEVSLPAKDNKTVEFGSLPEVISVDELGALNAALAEMFSMAREAMDWFEKDGLV
jgi:hypothetical protein